MYEANDSQLTDFTDHSEPFTESLTIQSERH